MPDRITETYEIKYECGCGFCVNNNTDFSIFCPKHAEMIASFRKMLNTIKK